MSDNLIRSNAELFADRKPAPILAALPAALALLLASCATPAFRAEPAAARPAPARLAIVGATLLPMTERGLALPDSVVLVEGGRVVAAGPASEITVPAGAAIIEARGKWLMPGLADAHVHFLFDAAAPLLNLANGVTTVRDMGSPTEAARGDRSLAFDDLLGLRSAIEAGRILGPTMVQASPMHESAKGLYFDKRAYIAVEDAEGARAAVRAAKEAGYDCFKVYNKLPAEALRAAADEAERLGIPVVGHVPHAVPLADVLEAGSMWSIEHLTGYINPFGGLKTKPEDLPTLAQAAAQAGVWSVPTLEVWRSIVPAGRIGEVEADPWARFEPASLKAFWRASIEGFGSRVRRGVPGFERLPSEHPQDFALVFQALHRAGAPIAAGTDAGTLNVVAGSSLRRELARYVELGMTPWEALASATVDSARCLRREGEFGVVAPGARADLLILGADPLADIGALDSLETVILRGAPWQRAELIALLEGLGPTRR